MSSLQEIPIDLAGATVTGWIEHAGRHLQLQLRLPTAGAAGGAPLDLYLLDVRFFGCLHNFLDSYVGEVTAGETPGEWRGTAQMDGLVYNPKRFSADQNLYLILRLESAGFKLNCGAFRFVDPTTETYQPEGSVDFQPEGDCG